MPKHGAARGPEDPRTIAVVALLKAFSNFGYDDGNQEIPLSAFERSYIYVATNARGEHHPALRRLLPLMNHRPLGHNSWLHRILYELAECGVLTTVFLGEETIILTLGAKKMVSPMFDEVAERLFPLDVVERDDLLRVAHMAVRFFQTIMARKDCDP